MTGRVSYKTFNSAFSFIDYANANNLKELKNKAKDIVRQSGACGYTGFKGITIKLVIEESGDEIIFNPR